MTQMHDAISAPGWLDRMAQLAVRNGVHLSSLQQKDGRDLELVFASAYLWFPVDRLLDERAANEVLKAFLAGAGVMLDTDHVELRSWLVAPAFFVAPTTATDYHRGALRRGLLTRPRRWMPVRLAGPCRRRASIARKELHPGPGCASAPGLEDGICDFRPPLYPRLKWKQPSGQRQTAKHSPSPCGFPWAWDFSCS